MLAGMRLVLLVHRLMGFSHTACSVPLFHDQRAATLLSFTLQRRVEEDRLGS